MKYLFKSLIAGAALATSAGAFALDVTGAGSSFANPLYSKWADSYQKAGGGRLNYQSVGSGAGIKQIEAKTVDFGASDAPLKDDELKAKNLVQFPMVIGGVVPVVNIKGIAAGQRGGAVRRLARTRHQHRGRSPRCAGKAGARRFSGTQGPPASSYEKGA